MTIHGSPEGEFRPSEPAAKKETLPVSMWPLNAESVFQISEWMPAISKDEILQLRYPWELLTLVQQKLAETVTEQRISSEAQISERAHIEGPVWIEEGVKILPFSVVIGPVIIGKNTLVGNHTQIRGSVIGPDSLIGGGTEFIRSVCLNNCSFHRNYVGDSFLDSHVSMGGTTSLSNQRLDLATIRSFVDEKLIDTGLSKLGSIVGSNTAIGGHVIVMPGVKIGANSLVAPRAQLHRDLPDDSKIRVVQEQITSPVTRLDR